MSFHSFNVEGDESIVNYEDYPDVHDSHDQNIYIKLDPNPTQADLLGHGDRCVHSRPLRG
jgi:hypothetical protein